MHKKREQDKRRKAEEQGSILNSTLGEKAAFEPRLEKRSYVNHRGSWVQILQKRKGQMQRLKYSWAVYISVIVNETDRGHC